MRAASKSSAGFGFSRFEPKFTGEESCTVAQRPDKLRNRERGSVLLEFCYIESVTDVISIDEDGGEVLVPVLLLSKIVWVTGEKGLELPERSPEFFR